VAATVIATVAALQVIGHGEDHVKAVEVEVFGREFGGKDGSGSGVMAGTSVASAFG
jgi:hypothetical protein